MVDILGTLEYRDDIRRLYLNKENPPDKNIMSGPRSLNPKEIRAFVFHARRRISIAIRDGRRPLIIARFRATVSYSRI